MAVLIRYKDGVFFKDCCLKRPNGGCICCGGGESVVSPVVECVVAGGVLRLVEDGYVYYDGASVKVGLLRDAGGWVSKEVYEDGAVYIYAKNIDGNGVFAADGEVDSRRKLAETFLVSAALNIYKSVVS